jgi:predicted RNA-binding protein with PIN domain
VVEKKKAAFDYVLTAEYSTRWRLEVPVIIDGNNLLFAARATEGEQLQIGRRLLCNALNEWARRRGERVHIVFDGPSPAAGIARQIGGPRVQVSYGGGKSADDVLIEFLEADSAARRLLVVSSDREIRRAAKRRRARAIGSDEFWALVKQDLSRRPVRRREPEEKERGLDSKRGTDWLREFGLDQGGED